MTGSKKNFMLPIYTQVESDTYVYFLNNQQ